MSFTFIKELPTPAEIKETFSLSERGRKIKEERDKEIRDVIIGKSQRFLVVIGPCSADNQESVLDYVSRLSRVQEKVADKLILVPRIYTNKPRTTGEGYKGIAHQPNPQKAPDLLGGMISARTMHIRSIEYYSLPSADEMLYPENWVYVEDLLSYVAIGARSVEDQHHRLTASGFDVPAGMKNPTSGDLSVMLNSVYAAQQPHHFIYRGHDVRTTGNELTHVILRGSVNQYGVNHSNYHYEDLQRLIEMYGKMELKYPAAIVDSNHSNSNKQYQEQVRIVKEVMHNRRISNDIRNMVKGVMVESYIEDGAQSPNEHVYGKSITDPCLGWAESEQLIYTIAEMCK